MGVEILDPALVVVRNGHRIRLSNEKTRVRIPPGYKVLEKHSSAAVYKMT
jgi:hypothetical protein